MHASAADAAPRHSGKKIFRTPGFEKPVPVLGNRSRAASANHFLTCLDAQPESIVNDAQVWDLGDDPLRRGIATRDTFASLRVAKVTQSIPD